MFSVWLTSFNEDQRSLLDVDRLVISLYGIIGLINLCIKHDLLNYISQGMGIDLWLCKTAGSTPWSGIYNHDTK